GCIENLKRTPGFSVQSHLSQTSYNGASLSSRRPPVLCQHLSGVWAIFGYQGLDFALCGVVCSFFHDHDQLLACFFTVVEKGITRRFHERESFKRIPQRRKPPANQGILSPQLFLLLKIHAAFPFSSSWMLSTALVIRATTWGARCMYPNDTRNACP